MPSEVVMGTAPSVTNEATELKRMVGTLEQIGLSAHSVMIQMDQFKRWLKRELKRNVELANVMSDNEDVEKFVNNTLEE